MPSLRVLLLACVKIGDIVEEPRHKHVLRLTSLDIHYSNGSEPCQWFKHALLPSALRHLSLSVLIASDLFPAGTLLIKSVGGSLETIMVFTNCVTEVYPFLVEDICPHLQRIDISLFRGLYSYSDIILRLPPAALCPLSLSIGLRVLKLELPGFFLLYAQLCELARAGMRWAAMEMYLWAKEAGSLETYHPALRMRDYERIRAMVGMLGGRHCDAQPHMATSPGVRSEGVCCTWWSLPADNAQPRYIVLEHDKPYGPTRALRSRAPQMPYPKLRTIHFVFQCSEHPGIRNLHVNIQSSAR